MLRSWITARPPPATMEQSRSEPDVTRLLVEWGKGDTRAFDELAPIVYDELRRLARRYLRMERPGHTLQSTALVHEAYLRLVDQRDVAWQSRAHFYGIAAQMIRRILVDHARSRLADKRGAAAPKIALDEALDVQQKQDVDVLALDEALQALTQIDERQCRMIELRYFVGLSIEETAEVLRVSPATVKREWTAARAWLKRELTRGERPLSSAEEP